MCGLFWLVGAGTAAADTFTTHGCVTWTVPTGVSIVQINASGASGWAAPSGGGGGGVGANVVETTGVTHGQTLYVCVDIGGGAGGSGSSAGGAGGGASGVSAGPSLSSPLLVAAGGGGGGGGGALGGTGGAPGSAGTGGTGSNGQPGTAMAGGAGGGVNGGAGGADAGGVGGTAGTSGNGGGGGGAGYYGGGGGAGSPVLGGGGGGGGSNYCSLSSCTAGTPASEAEVILSYTVASPPTASIITPANGATYPLNGIVDSSFSCAEAANGPGLSSCTDQSGHGSGSPIDTSSPGPHTFTVTAISSDGQTATSPVTYNVVAPPAIWLPLPANGATFIRNQAVRSYFLCADGKGGPGLTSCVDQNGRTAGALLNTSRTGRYQFTVIAISADGQVTASTSTYVVVLAPTVSKVRHLHGFITFNITLPAGGAVDAIATASSKSFTGKPPRASILYGRSHIVASRSGTVPMIVVPDRAGSLLLRHYGRATMQLVIKYTGEGGLSQTIAAMTLKVTR